MGFEYLRPTEWAEASRLVAEPGAVAKMGGCDVLTRFRGGRLQADVVVGLDRIRGTRELRFDDGAVTMGAGVTLADLERSAMFARRFPTIARVVRDIASPAIRHQASVIGNVAQGWDVGDLVPLLQVLDATLELVGPSGSRTMSVAEYARLRGHASLAPGELITTLAISTPGHAFRLGYERFAFKDSFELPLVAAAVGGRVEKGVARDVRVALVGTGPMPARSTPAEVSLDGRALDDATIAACVRAAMRDTTPPDDHRASGAYRRHVASVMLGRALRSLIEHQGDRP